MLSQFWTLQLDVVEGQRIGTEAAIQGIRVAEIGVGEVAELGGIVVGAEIDGAIDDAAAIPDETVGAKAHQHIAADRAA